MKPQWAAVVLLSLCNDSLDREKAIERTLTAQLAEKKVLLENRDAFEAEYDDLLALQSTLETVSTDELQKAFTNAETVKSKDESFYAVHTVTGTGGKAGLHRALDVLPGFKRRLTLLYVQWSPNGWMMKVATLKAPQPQSKPHISAARLDGGQADEGCRGGCATLRSSNEALKVETAALDAQLGRLADINRRRKVVNDDLAVLRKLECPVVAQGLKTIDDPTLVNGAVAFGRDGFSFDAPQSALERADGSVPTR